MFQEETDLTDTCVSTAPTNYGVFVEPAPSSSTRTSTQAGRAGDHSIVVSLEAALPGHHKSSFGSGCLAGMKNETLITEVYIILKLRTSTIMLGQRAGGCGCTNCEIDSARTLP